MSGDLAPRFSYCLLLVPLNSLVHGTNMPVTNPYGTYRVTASRVNTFSRMTILSKLETHKESLVLARVPKYLTSGGFIALGETVIAT